MEGYFRGSSASDTYLLWECKVAGCMERMPSFELEALESNPGSTLTPCEVLGTSFNLSEAEGG